MFNGKKVSSIAEIESLETVFTKKLFETNLTSNPNTQYVILYNSMSNIDDLKQIIKNIVHK